MVWSGPSINPDKFIFQQIATLGEKLKNQDLNYIQDKLPINIQICYIASYF